MSWAEAKKLQKEHEQINKKLDCLSFLFDKLILISRSTTLPTWRKTTTIFKIEGKGRLISASCFCKYYRYSSSYDLPANSYVDIMLKVDGVIVANTRTTLSETDVYVISNLWLHKLTERMGENCDYTVDGSCSVNGYTNTMGLTNVKQPKSTVFVTPDHIPFDESVEMIVSSSSTQTQTPSTVNSEFHAGIAYILEE